jgi:hypothetical protein
MKKFFQYVFLGVLFLVNAIEGLNRIVRISEDSRQQISLGGYGFLKDGYLRVNLTDYSVNDDILTGEGGRKRVRRR